MKNKAKFIELNSVVNKTFALEDLFKKHINEQVEQFKLDFKEMGYSVVKIGEYGMKTLTCYDKSIEVDLALVKYGKRKIDLEQMFQKIILYLQKKYSHDEIRIFKNEGVIRIKRQGERKIYFKLSPFYCQEKPNGLKPGKYVFLRNDDLRHDNLIPFVQAFNKANSISNNLLRSLVKLIKYVIKSDFKYFYIIEIIILRWFYEYFSKKYNSFIQTKAKNNIEQVAKNIKIYNSKAYMKKWFVNNINGEDLIYYILERFWKKETYYFREFEFIEEEIFDSISRYSWYTNNSFLTPYDYFLQVKIFDLTNMNDLTMVQQLIKNNVVSRIAFDDIRNNEMRFLVSPIRSEGVVGFNEYASCFNRKSQELFKKLDPEKRKNVFSINQREIMEELNLIAHRWLSTYRNKLTYIKIYFDKKYPIVSNLNYYLRIQTILETVDKLHNEDYFLGYDN